MSFNPRAGYVDILRLAGAFADTSSGFALGVFGLRELRLGSESAHPVPQLRLLSVDHHNPIISLFFSAKYPQT